MSDWKGTKAPTATSRSSYAAAISRVLRKGGVPTRSGSSSRSREGVRVAQDTDTTARVFADFNTDSDARRMADAAEDALHAAGHRTTRRSDSSLLVHRDGTVEESRDLRHLAGSNVDGVWQYPTLYSGKARAQVRIEDREVVVVTEGGALTAEVALKLSEQIADAASQAAQLAQVR